MSTNEVAGAWRVPDDLPQRIVANSERMRRADDRHDRREVAIKASALMAYVNSERGKLAHNRERGASRRKAAQ